MIITNTDNIPGKEVAEILGLVEGSTVRSKNAIKDVGAGLKSIVGGELGSYTKLQEESRSQAIERMQEKAGQMGADAVINVRLTTSMVAAGAAEILAYGTAVKLS